MYICYISATCDECQTNNHLRKVPGELHPIPPPDESFTQFGMDLIGPFKETKNGNKYVIVLTDYLTKWPEAAPIPDKKATTIASFLVKVICRYSSIEVLITDQGREFCNKINEEICVRVGIDHRKTSAYHPQSNGLTERYNQTLTNSIVKYTNDEQDDWDDFIEPALLAYRTAEQSSTKQTPFFLAFGRKPTLLIEQSYPVGAAATTSSEQDQLDMRVAAAAKMVEIHTDAKEEIQQSHKRQKKYFDRKRQGPTYKAGDKVYVNNPKRINRKGDKLARRWRGPYEITEVLRKGTYRLKGVKSLVNASRMKPHKSPKTKINDQQTEKCQLTPIVPTMSAPTSSACQPTPVTPNMSAPMPTAPNKCQPIHNHPTKNVPVTRRKPGNVRRKSLQSHDKLKKGKLSSSSSQSTRKSTCPTRVQDHEKVVFNPVDKLWQNQRAGAMGYTVEAEIPTCASSKVSILEPPGDKIRIKGDGNCYFRTISHVLTGNERSHGQIRKHVCDYTKAHNKTISKFSQTKDYVHTSRMDLNGTWGTDIEIIATASMLATDICAYSPYGCDSVGNRIYKWLTYSPLPGLNSVNSLRMSRKKMYISNVSDHYVPVYKMDI